MSKNSYKWKQERFLLNKVNKNHNCFIFSKKEMGLKAYRKEKRYRNRVAKERRKDIKDSRSQYYNDINIKKNIDYFRIKIRS